MHIHFRQHTHYYTLLFTYMILGITLILQASYDRSLQAVLVVFISFIYALLGILHHYFEHDITAKIVIEYVLTSTLGMAIILLLI